MDVQRDFGRNRLNAVPQFPDLRAIAAASPEGPLGWLHQLRLRHPLAVELLDRDLITVLPRSVGVAPDIGPTLGAHVEVLHVAAAAAFRAGKARTFTAGAFRVRACPLSVGEAWPRDGIGLLLVADHLPPAGSASALDDVDRRLDAAGQWLVAAIDWTIRHVAEFRTANLHGVLELLPALETIDTVPQLIDVVVEGIAIWFDADVRAYHLDPSGSFQLTAWLPGVDVARIPRRLNRSALWERDGLVRIDSARALDEVGWDSRQPDAVFVPIRVGDSVDWLITATPARPEIDPVLDIVRRLVALRASAIDRDASDRMRRRLTAVLEAADAGFATVARRALETIAAVGGASRVVLDIRVGDVRHAPPAIRIDTAPPPSTVREVIDGDLPGTTVERTLPLGDRILAILTCQRDIGTFAIDRLRMLDAGVELLGAWLLGVITHPDLRLVPASSLADRLAAEISRADRQPDTGAVVVVVPDVPAAATTEDLNEAAGLLRDQVRASDAVETVSSAFVAALLVDADAPAASSIVQRVARQARRCRTRFRVGSVQIGVGLPPEAVLNQALAVVRPDSSSAGVINGSETPTG